MFDKLDTHQASLTNNNSPKSIWQILNHLILWQDYQLKKLNNEETKDINEVDTWYAETTITDQYLLNDTIAKFEKQIEMIRAELRGITTEEKVKTVQDLPFIYRFIWVKLC